ncbi:hypothetical protein, partial [Rhodoferax sp.]|uniref:hypothetical protein n=1 Tax=Rhodoferax sp. TaxID=50421 RepID=UPI002ACEC20D
MANPPVYVFSSGAVQSQTGSAQPIGSNLNTGIHNTTANPQLGLLESIDKSVKDAVKGTEAWHGSGGLGSTGSLGAAGVVAGAIAKLDDITAVGNNLLAGQFLESAMETAGALAGPVGGVAGAWFAGKAIGALPEFYAPLRAPATLVSIFAGDKYTGDLTKEFVYGEWVQATAPAIPADANLQPSRTVDGTNYYVVSTKDQNGAPRTYIYTDSGNVTGSDPLLFPNQPRYMPVVDQNISKDVVKQVLSDIGFDPNITQQQWNVMNGVSPSGYAVDSVHYEPVGNLQTIGTGPNAQTSQSVVQVRTFRDPETGAIMEVRVPGNRMDGSQFEITGAPFSIGMDTAGKTIIPGVTEVAPSPPGVGIDSLGQVGSTTFEDL